MKSEDLAKILLENPGHEVLIAIGSFRVDTVKNVEKVVFCDDIEHNHNVPALSLIGLHYKQVETKGVDYV